MGIMIWSEIPAYQVPDAELRAITPSRGRRTPREHPRERQPPLDHRLVDRQRARPHGRPVADALHRRRPSRPRIRSTRRDRSASPTRADRRSPCQEGYDALDVLGINDYFGWYPGPYGEIADPSLLSDFLAQERACYPKQALLVTEYGAEANRDGPIDERGTYEYQSQFITDQLADLRRDAVAERRGLLGAPGLPRAARAGPATTPTPTRPLQQGPLHARRRGRSRRSRSSGRRTPAPRRSGPTCRRVGRGQRGRRARAAQRARAARRAQAGRRARPARPDHSRISPGCMHPGAGRCMHRPGGRAHVPDPGREARSATMPGRMSTSTLTRLDVASRAPGGSREARRMRRRGLRARRPLRRRRRAGQLHGRRARAARRARRDAAPCSSSRSTPAARRRRSSRTPQRHPVRGDLVHVDLVRVRLDQAIQANVPLDPRRRRRGARRARRRRARARHAHRPRRGAADDDPRVDRATTSRTMAIGDTVLLSARRPAGRRDAARRARRDRRSRR